MVAGPPPADSRELDAGRARDDQPKKLRLIHTQIAAQMRNLELRQIVVLRRLCQEGIFLNLRKTFKILVFRRFWKVMHHGF